MIRSMTGFGKATKETSQGIWTVEIQSLNRKFFEIALILPKDGEGFSWEMDLRTAAKKVIFRGQLTVRVRFTPSSKESTEKHSLLALRGFWEQIAEEIGYSKEVVTFPFLVQQKNLLPLSPEEEKPRKEALFDCYEQALVALITMKTKEGEILCQDLQNRLKRMNDLLHLIEGQLPLMMEQQSKNFYKRVKELLKATPPIEDAIAKEVVFFLEKVDIQEEITRLHSHFQQFAALLQSSKDYVGREMDFLAQEMGREANTMGAKAVDLSISAHVIEMKCELDRIREQIQNIE